MNKLKTIIASFLLLPVLGFGIALSMPAANVGAACDTDGSVSVSSGAKCAKSDDQKASLGDSIRTVTNVLLFIIGAVAVIMIIIGGIRYTTSNGDSSQVAAAKNTILYGVVGVIIALLAYAIVNFVVGAFTKSDGGSDDTGGTSATN